MLVIVEIAALENQNINQKYGFQPQSKELEQPRKCLVIQQTKTKT